MKLEGMDAVARVAGVQGQALDPPYGNAGPTGGAKTKSADGADFVAPIGSSAKKARVPADAQAFAKKYQQPEDDEADKFIHDAIERANRALQGGDRKFEITIHEKTKDIMVKVVDTNTNETIREIPPKKIVDLVVRLCEIAGILYDEKG